MGYIYDNVSGRIAANFLQGTPTPPAGFTLTSDPILNTDILDSKRDVIGAVIVKRNALVVAGGPISITPGAVGQVAVQKIDGTTLAPMNAPDDNDPVAYDLESENAFLSKKSGNLVQGADSVKVGAPAVSEQARLLVFSPELQLLDTTVSFA